MLKQQNPTDWVNVFHGCDKMAHPAPERLAASWFFIKAIVGNTLPAATLPFGKYSCCSYTSGYPSGYSDNCPNSSPWDLNHLPEGARFYGLSHFHLSGTGGIETYYNLARLTPFFGDCPPACGETMMSEDGEPGYYAVRLDSGITCQTTVSAHGAYHRFLYGAPGGKLLFNVTGNGLNSRWERMKGHRASGEITLAENQIRAAVTIDGITHHFLLSAPHTRLLGIIQDGNLISGTSYTFDLDASESYCGVLLEAEEETAETRFADSLVDFSRAQAEMRADDGSFDTVRNAAHTAWDRVLSAIEIEGASERERAIFYSNFYHTLVKPCERPGDNPFEATADNAPFCVDFCTMWDMYKTQLPLVLTLFPSVGQTILETFASINRAWGKFPIALLLDADRERCANQAAMLAEHTICDAFWRGIPADYGALLDAVENDMAQPAIAQIVSGGTPRRLTHLLDVCEGCGDVADLAEALGRHDFADRLRKVEARWADAYDPSTGLLRAGYEYYEGNDWNYSFRLLRHMDERVQMIGKDQYIALLDRFFGFSAPWVTNTRFEGFNNESDMEAPYAYHVISRMDRIAAIVDAAHTFLFTEGRGGIPGNNDSGGLSSAYMWNAMGIFPVAGQNKMLIGSPRYGKVTLHLPNGKDFVIEHRGKGFTVTRATLDGDELPNFSFTVTRMMQGGTLLLETK